MSTYTAYGLTICSDFELPELLPLPPQDAQACAVRIRLGAVPTELTDPVGTGVLYQAKPNEFLLRLDAVAGYWVTGGTEIVVDPVVGATDEEIRLFLLGSALGALLHQRGLLVIHANAIETPKGAILISGTSGSGKSTLGAALWQRGYRLLADDVCAVAPNPDDAATPIVLPGYPQTKLWADTATKLALDTDALRRVRPQLDKFAVPLESLFVRESLPLYAVYLLQTHNKGDLLLAEVEHARKFGVLLHNTYRGRFLDGLAMRVEHFGLVTMAANAARVVRVTRPSHPYLLDELASAVEADFLEERCDG
ncbi:MAG: hypothetical protein MUF54_24950 [Polyangiaceae bacterium]|jgi:hypothetical protein|nr:hypothetical protein [Anaerolineae bacterium]MCU0694641.1 hypothetical protein [Polyangiaceae bacterium]